MHWLTVRHGIQIHLTDDDVRTLCGMVVAGEDAPNRHLVGTHETWTAGPCTKCMQSEFRDGKWRWIHPKYDARYRAIRAEQYAARKSTT